MEWPLVLNDMSHATEMVIAVFIGIGFGFVLERAGFGHPKNLTAIFYGRDFRVMRVMFTAIVTGVIGLYFLDLTGFMPIGNVGLLPTYVGPQILGGFVLGAGFIVGGYCPGTSVVASASGKLDGAFFVVGLFAGLMTFTIAYDSIAGFHSTGQMGRILLHEYFDIPSGVMVMAVMLFAVGSLYAVTRIERLVNHRSIQKEGSK